MADKGASILITGTVFDKGVAEQLRRDGYTVTETPVIESSDTLRERLTGVSIYILGGDEYVTEDVTASPEAKDLNLLFSSGSNPRRFSSRRRLNRSRNRAYRLCLCRSTQMRWPR